ncbi:MAG: hypothetical protein Q8K32_31225 [Archangium sp.]|nr:hypothetical protein [Archangium sp.]
MSDGKPVMFEAQLMGYGDAAHLDLAEYSGQDVLLFVASVEEIRKAGALLRKPTRLHAETPLIASAAEVLSALEAVLPYAESRAEDMDENVESINEDDTENRAEAKEYADKAWAAVSVATELIASLKLSADERVQHFADHRAEARDAALEEAAQRLEWAMPKTIHQDTMRGACILIRALKRGDFRVIASEHESMHGAAPVGAEVARFATQAQAEQFSKSHAAHVKLYGPASTKFVVVAKGAQAISEESVS